LTELWFYSQYSNQWNLAQAPLNFWIMKALREALTWADREGRAIENFKVSEIAGPKAAVVSARVLNVPVLVGVSGRVPRGTPK
jgi:hypothetical protein